MDDILEQVPGRPGTGRFPTGYDDAFNGPCSGNWTAGATGGGDGSAPYSKNSDGMGYVGFPTVAQASDSAARLVESLRSCEATAWKTLPIARTGGVLAASPEAVAWIQRTGDMVSVLHVRTTAGPPPLGVQIDVAEWMVTYRTWQEQN